MNKSTITIAIIAAAILSGCSSQSALHNREQVSWSAFCHARGHAINDNTSDVQDEYLDTWCGSVGEEQAFINARIYGTVA